MWQYGEDVWGRLSLQGRPPLLVQPAVRSKARRRRGQGSLAASPRPTDIGAGCTSSESFAHPLFKDKERQKLRSEARRKGVTASQSLALPTAVHLAAEKVGCTSSKSFAHNHRPAAAAMAIIGLRLGNFFFPKLSLW